MHRVLYTIGYQGISAESFVALLERVDIELVADVRELPLSRKRGFSKTPLMQRLGARGIRYENWRSLGSPRWMRQKLRAEQDREWFREAYLSHLDDVLGDARDLLDEAIEQRTCLLCYEADPAECHRSLLAERLQELAGDTDLEVIHLRAEDAPSP